MVPVEKEEQEAARPASRKGRASSTAPTSQAPVKQQSRTRAASQQPAGTSKAAASLKSLRQFVPVIGMNALPQPIVQTGISSSSPVQVFVFGTGDMGQNGLGEDALGEIVRPRLHVGFNEMNAQKEIGSLGIEQIAAGGMHTLAVDNLGRILTWGINDNAALGRSTTRQPGVDAEVYETRPMPVEGLSPDGKGLLPGPLPLGGTEGQVETFRAVRVAAGDSVSAALNSNGEVRVWGSFRSNDGPMGFDGRTGTVKMQFTPVSLPGLGKNSFCEIVCGADHVVALTSKGHVYTWGNGQQYQLGRRIIERFKINGLTPEKLHLKDIVHVGAGAYHSFAIDKNGKVLAWGLNSLNQLGIESESQTDFIPMPTVVPTLSPVQLGGAKVVSVTGGEHHSLFLLSDGRVFGTGRCDGCELGLADDHPAKLEVLQRREEWKAKREADLAQEMVEWQKRMEEKRLRQEAAGDGGGMMGMVMSQGDMQPTLGPPPDEYVPRPVHIPFPPSPVDGKPTRIVKIVAGPRFNIAIAADGTPYSWGFGNQAQLGQGDEEVVVTPTPIRSKQFAGYKAVDATAGGQHCALLAVKAA
ncbi:RCC1/BLIP-II [Ceraceosorus guamensis]|uniref:RCC1/BLIP-II n=1 Tax=Ceraceosorus guamensis TaxID=1522189 RepID=A0A316VMC1_9BASI|nr:RCC1/BLIP-II [Ceraceosorus guamensis]PWN38779.1 RCC1/BLIP-II [Ceraceosorus guamensis]